MYRFRDYQTDGSFWVGLFEDCYCSIRIIDESLPSGVRVRFFTETMQKLPAIQSVGDIVLVTNVLVNESLVQSLFLLFLVVLIIKLWFCTDTSYG